MGKRQECHMACTGESQVGVNTESYIPCQRIARRNNTLREARCTACVVNASHLRIRTLVVMHFALSVAIRVVLCKLFHYRVMRDRFLIPFRSENTPFVEREHRQYIRNLFGVYSFPVGIGHKEQLCFRMIYDMNGIIGFEILQNRHNDSPIGHGSQIDRHPIAVILTHQSNFIVFLDACLLKQYVQMSDDRSQLPISEGSIRSVVCYRFKFPIRAERCFEYLYQIVFFLCQHKMYLIGLDIHIFSAV